MLSTIFNSNFRTPKITCEPVVLWSTVLNILPLHLDYCKELCSWLTENTIVLSLDRNHVTTAVVWNWSSFKSGFTDETRFSQKGFVLKLVYSKCLKIHTQKGIISVQSATGCRSHTLDAGMFVQTLRGVFLFLFTPPAYKRQFRQHWVRSLWSGSGYSMHRGPNLTHSAITNPPLICASKYICAVP